MQMFLELLSRYGMETAVCALCVNLLTGIFKIPVKSLAEKKGWTGLSKAVVFLPLAFAFGVSLLCRWIQTGAADFGEEFYTLWLSSASLSLAIYAIFEKIFPSKRRILEEQEIKQNLEAIEKLEEKKPSSPPKERKVL